MRRLTLFVLLIGTIAAVSGCGSRSNDSASTPANSSSAPVAGTAAGGDPSSASSPLDVGPRANSTPVDHEAAELGETLFSSKGCTACHGFGKKLTGPDLAGVTERRTAQWIESQILHPEVMTKNDPIAHQLYATFALQMPNQHLTQAEALDVIEYLKHRNAGGGAEHKEDKR